jgi:hypothetical protein
MDLTNVTFGEEAQQFLARYALREDAVAYARANATVAWQEGEWLVVIGHDPDNCRFRMTCKVDDPGRIVTVRPVE